MSASRLATLVGGAVLPLLLIACDSKDVFETCATTQKVQADCKTAIALGSDQCGEAEVFCYDSCVVRDHPQCSEGPCMLYEGRNIGEPKPTDSVDTSFCTVPCHGEACPSDAVCREVRSLKAACTVNSDCERAAPWSRCEPARFCETSRKACEVAADCGGEACVIDDAAPRTCTYKFCIPLTYAPGT